MIRIAITAEAFEAICRVERLAVNKLAALRDPAKDYSAVILRLVEMEAARR